MSNIEWPNPPKQHNSFYAVVNVMFIMSWSSKENKFRAYIKNLARILITNYCIFYCKTN